MLGVVEATILYLIANNIKIECDYCVFNDHAVPVNTCLDMSDASSTLTSYQFVCNGANDGSVFKLDYSDATCTGPPQQTAILHNLLEYGCVNHHGITCASDQSALVSTSRVDDPQYSAQIRYITNKCILLSARTVNISKITQCTDTSLTEWIFNDIGCTAMQSVTTYSEGDVYPNDNVLLQSIAYCPPCTLDTDYDTSITQHSDLNINYVIINDGINAFPEAIDVCNVFVLDGRSASYKYSCHFTELSAQIHKTIWNNDSHCDGIYNEYHVVQDTEYLDLNCVNYAIQTSFVRITRYTNHVATGSCAPDLSYPSTQIAYVTNRCTKQNHNAWIIIEAHGSFIAVHYFTDDQCKNNKNACLTLWKTNDCNLHNPNYYESIDGLFGATRQPMMFTTDVDSIITTQNPLDVALSIDIKHTDTNYINRHHYKEPMNVCNEYVEYGTKSSYKYICSKDANKAKYKKRKWKNKRKCDADGDGYDEEEDIDDEGLEATCDYSQDVTIKYCKVNCFHNNHHWEQNAVILNNCIQINQGQNSLYIECFSDHTVTYYYYNHDCTSFNYKEHWYGTGCVSRYSKYLLKCDWTSPTPSPLHYPTTAIPTTSASPTTDSPTPFVPTTPVPTTSVPTAPTTTTTAPTESPTGPPTMSPTANPTTDPTPFPSSLPTSFPSTHPTWFPSIQPTRFPFALPTSFPSTDPTWLPSAEPTQLPSTHPTFPPSPEPTDFPSTQPTWHPSTHPTAFPSTHPTHFPSMNPSVHPSIPPSIPPTLQTDSPSTDPTASPTIPPTGFTVAPTTFPIVQPTLFPTTGPSIPPSASPTLETVSPTTDPTILPSAPPTLQTLSPTINPSISPTTVEPTFAGDTLNPSVDPTVSPTVNPTVLPTRSPSEDPTINPSTDPTLPPTVPPSLAPTQNFPTLTVIPTSITPTTASPADRPTTFIPTTFVPTTRLPTLSPTVPSAAPTLSPTGEACELEIYQTYNETNASYWLSNASFTDRYAGFVEEAFFLTYQNLTGHSMKYEDRDEWNNSPWSFAGIVNYQTCMLFTIKNESNPIDDCPHISEPNPGNAQFVSVVWFCVVADQNEDEFREYMFDVSDSAEFNDVFDFYLNPIVWANTPCCLPNNNNVVIRRRRARRLVNIVYTHITIRTYGVDPKQLKIGNALPMAYQGIFTNTPVVIGDITIILLIIFGLMSVAALLCWYARRDCSYSDSRYARFYGDNDIDDKDHAALPLKK
eukprot:341925_1